MSRIDEIKAVFEANATVLEQCAAYLNHTPNAMTKELMEQITGNEKELEQSSFALFFANLFFEDQDKASYFYKEYYSKGIKKLDPSEYTENPYYKNIKIPKAQIESWTLGFQKYEPYEAFAYNDYLVQGYREIPRLGFFDSEFLFPTVFENGVEWMAIKPNEIETMKEPIAKAHSNVLVCGLGLGYFAYMVSQKSSVHTVTVVERDEKVISLFEKYILPQFENKHKIKVIKADALEYLKEDAPKEKYDFAFVDLWHDTSDGVDIYINVKKLEMLSPNTEFSYWIEHSIVSSVKASIFNAIYTKIKAGELEKNDKELEKMLSDSYIKELVKYL